MPLAGGDSQGIIFIEKSVSMRLKPFKKEKRSNRYKLTMIILSSLAFIFLFIAIYQSFAAYNIKHSETIVDAKVGSLYDIRLLAIYIDGEPQPEMTEFPKDKEFSHVRCYVDGEYRENITGTWENDSLTIKLFTSKTDCNVYFITFVRNFAFTGTVQTFTVSMTGTYQIELWGAVGGAPAAGLNRSFGGYTSGIIHLEIGTTLHIYVGELGGNARSGANQGVVPGGYNGGGSGGNSAQVFSIRGSGGSGGGATDVRLSGGNWNDVTGLRNRIMVAAGGGGSSAGVAHSYSPSGGLASPRAHSITVPTINDYAAQGGGGANQTSGGAIGIGSSLGWPSLAVNGAVGTFGIVGPGPSVNHPASDAGAGGGGGYWGGGSGGAGLNGHGGDGAGGSSFISGHTGAVAIISATNQNPRTNSTGGACATGTTDNVCSRHYSGRVFTNTVMIDGMGRSWTHVSGSQVQMPNPNGGNYALGQGHNGNGFARITKVS